MSRPTAPRTRLVMALKAQFFDWRRKYENAWDDYNVSLRRQAAAKEERPAAIQRGDSQKAEAARKSIILEESRQQSYGWTLHITKLNLLWSECRLLRRGFKKEDLGNIDWEKDLPYSVDFGSDCRPISPTTRC